MLVVLIIAKKIQIGFQENGDPEWGWMIDDVKMVNDRSDMSDRINICISVRPTIDLPIWRASQKPIPMRGLDGGVMWVS